MRKEKVHSHAKAANVKKSIARETGIPESAIQFVGPDGKKVRSDIKIENLRKKFLR